MDFNIVNLSETSGKIPTAVLALTICAALYLLQKYRKPGDVLSRVPGPSSASFLLGNENQVLDHVAQTYTSPWKKQYGRTYKTTGTIFNRRRLVTTDPAACHFILKHDNEMQRPAFEHILFKRIANHGILVTTTEAEHMRHRRLTQPAFSSTVTRTHMGVFQSHAIKLKDRWTQLVQDANGERVKVNGHRELSAVVMDMFTEVAWGAQMKSIDGLSYPKAPLIEACHRLLIDNFLSPPPLLFLLRDLFGVLPSSVGALLEAYAPIDFIRKTHHNTGIIDVYCKQVIKDRLADDEAGAANKDKSLITALIKANKLERNPAKQLADKELLGTIKTFLSAGSDTTAQTAVWGAYELCRNQRVQSKLRAEIREARARIGPQMFTSDQLEALPYLNACVKELLRLDPVAPQRDRQAKEALVMPLASPVTLTDGTKVNEIPIFPGDTVTVDIANYNRDPELWGADAEEFRPERWIELTPEMKAQEGQPLPGIFGRLLTFVDGPRNCLGWRFAVAELQAIFATLIEDFEWSFAVDEKNITRGMAATTGPVINHKYTEGFELPMWVSLVKE